LSIRNHIKLTDEASGSEQITDGASGSEQITDGATN
jgi:hypothetical protein